MVGTAGRSRPLPFVWNVHGPLASCSYQLIAVRRSVSVRRGGLRLSHTARRGQRTLPCGENVLR